jgi:hypothetical protein
MAHLKFAGTTYTRVLWGEWPQRSIYSIITRMPEPECGHKQLIESPACPSGDFHRDLS